MNNIKRFQPVSLFLNGLVNSMSVVYSSLCLFILFCFLLLRIPYLYGEIGFLVFTLFFILPLFLSLFYSRVFNGINIFFASFIPVGTPLWISFFVGLAETISYCVRPGVLIIRPFLNISIGAMGGASMTMLFLGSYNPLLLAVLLFVFLYEIFVALVHWFIVCNILSFSVDH